jgi:hypothetical protein
VPAGVRTPAATWRAITPKSTTARPTPNATAPDVNDLTFGCGGHHPLAEQGWTTRKNHHGDTEWIPPPHLDYGQPRVNTFHHPEKLLRDDDVP